MKTAFDQNLCLAWLKKGRLRPAMEYLAQFPEQAELYRQYMSLYQQEHYLSYDVDSQLQDTVYQFDHVEGVVQKVKKSSQLRDAINNGVGIIITAGGWRGFAG